MMSTTHHILGDKQFLRKTHENHPCTKWVRESSENYLWLHNLATEVCKEYTHRYNKVHKYDREGLLGSLKELPTSIPIGPMTPFVQCMSDQYKDVDPVTAYRNYYFYDKSAILQYTNRDYPEWLTNYKESS